MVWVDDTTVIYLNTSNSAILGGVELWLASIADFKSGYDDIYLHQPDHFLTASPYRYKAASIPAPLENLKIAVTKSGDINFLLTGKAWANGTAYNEKLAATPLSSARIYDSLYVRHWDTYVTRQKSTLFSGVLKGNTKKTFNGKLTNLLTGTKNLETPIPPFGDVWNFDIAQDGQMVAFMSKAPELPQANYTAAYIYLVPFDGSAVARALNGPTSMAAKRYPKALGASQSPTFAPDGRTLAYFQMDGISYESDRNKLYIADLATGDIRGVAHNWDRSPFGITYSKDGKTIWLAAEERARSKIFTISASAGEVATPIAISHEGYVTASYQIGPNTLLASNTSLLQSYGYSIVDMHGKNPPKVLLDPRVVDPELEGLTDSQVEEFWFKGNWTDIQGWIIKPADFDPKKKYPLAMLFHGGPQGSWANVWSSRWSPAAWAAQGYVIVAINPTGSFGFGQKLTDAVQNNWGGAPYYDIILGFKHIAANYPYIDTKNAVAAGASFGGVCGYQTFSHWNSFTNGINV